MKKKHHQGSDYEQALQCAKGHGNWDPARDCAEADVAIEDAFGLVVWKPPHTLLCAGTVSSIDEIRAATSRVPGDYSRLMAEAAEKLPRCDGVLRTIVVCMTDKPVVHGLRLSGFARSTE